MRDYGFGDFLRDMRVRRGLSQHQLGALVGVSGKAVSKWENGVSKPKSSLLSSIGNVLGVAVDELLCAGNRRYEEKETQQMKSQLWEKGEKLLAEKYGDHPDIRIMNRWMSEYAMIGRGEGIIAIDLAAKIYAKVREHGGHVRFGTSLYSSFTAYVMGASCVNPLLPHYYCPICRKTKFSCDARIGYDLPVKKCACGREFERDGFGIPAAEVRKLDGLVTMLAVITAEEYAGIAKQAAEEYFRGKTMVTFRRSDSDGFERVVFFPEKMGGMSHGDVRSLEGNMRLTMEYPSVTFFMDHEEMKRYAELERETNTSFERIGFLADEVFRGFSERNTGGIAEFDGAFIGKVLDDINPASFSDLYRIMGLTHGTGVYIENGQDLLADGMSPDEVIAYREDVFLYVQKRMKAKDLDDKGFACRVMEESCRSRSGISDEVKSYLGEIGCEEWFIESAGKCRYLFPMGDGAYFFRLVLILMWYKQNFPDVFHRIIIQSKKSE